MTAAAKSSAVSAITLCTAVALGSAVGALLRFQSGAIIMAHWGGGDLLATAVVNVVGSFVIILFATLTTPEGRYPMGEITRQFVMGGICGGYTTRSLMGLNTLMLILDRHWLLGGAYVAGVVLSSLAAAAAGYWIALKVNRPFRRSVIAECRALS